MCFKGVSQRGSLFDYTNEEAIRMKKLLSLLLCLMLIAGSMSSAIAAAKFAPSGVQDAQQKAMELMRIVAFNSEYGSGHNLVRWERPIRIYVGGIPTSQDRRTIDDFILELACHVPMMPNVTVVSRESEANITIWFGPLKQLRDHVTDYHEGNWGAFHYWYSSYRITRAEIGIASDVTSQKERNHLIMEELIGVFGLGNDQDDYSDSIVYQPWTTTQELSDVDWLMMNMLYHPDVTPGMSWSQFERVTRQRINNR